MRLTTALFAGCLAALGSAALAQDTVTVNFLSDNPTTPFTTGADAGGQFVSFTALGGTTYTFTGSVTVTGTEDAAFGEGSVGVPSSFSGTYDNTPFALNYPGQAANTTTGPFDLFTITPTSDITFDKLYFNVSVFNANGAPIGTSAVPEPGSVAMLMGSTISGGLFLARRRRK